MDAGNQVLIMIDANENLLKNTPDIFRHEMESLGLNKLIVY